MNVGLNPWQTLQECLKKLTQAQRDKLTEQLLAEAHPCVMQGHSYIKVGQTKAETGWLASKPATAHLICRRCGQQKTIVLTR